MTEPPRVRIRPVRGFDGLRDVEPLALGMWDGGPGDPATEVRLGTDAGRLLVEFRCHSGEWNVDPEATRLWERDVVEVFLSDRVEGVPYREIEVSPLGQWLALSFESVRVPSREKWECKPEVSVTGPPNLYTVRLGLDLGAVRSGPWRLGLFRIAGREPRRRFLSLVPTGTPAPDFHRPERCAVCDLDIAPRP